MTEGTTQDYISASKLSVPFPPFFLINVYLSAPHAAPHIILATAGRFGQSGKIKAHHSRE
jgi:hypothetical protein